MKTFRSFLQLAGAVGEAIVSFAVAASGPGRELVKWITQGVEKFTEWMKSAEGRTASISSSRRRSRSSRP